LKGRRRIAAIAMLTLIVLISFLSLRGLNLILHAWEGGSEGEVRVIEKGVDARIVSFSIFAGEFKVGDKVYADVTIRNTGEVKHTFYVNFSIQDPKGEWWDANYEAVTLNPDEIGRVTLYWVVDSSAPPGSYNARVAVWKSKTDDILVERLDYKEQSNVFKVVVSYQLYGYVKYKNEEGEEVPLENVKVVVTWGIWPLSGSRETITTGEGFYKFNDLDPKNTYTLEISLINPYVKIIKEVPLGFDEIVSKRIENIKIPNCINVTFSKGIEGYGALAYTYALQAVKFYERELGVKLQYLPVVVKLTERPNILAEFRRPSKEIWINAGLLEKEKLWPKYADIVVWHEFTHFVIYSLCGEFPSHEVDLNGNGRTWEDKNGNGRLDPDEADFGEMDLNHGNWKNHCTSDSLNEGIAVFMSVVMRSILRGGDDYEPLRGFLDRGLPSSEYLKEDASYEGEVRAIAAVLWDLYDNENITDSRSGDKEDEKISLPILEIWKGLTGVYRLPNYYDEKGYWNPKWEVERVERHVYYLRDLFEVFSPYEELFKMNYIPKGFTREGRA